MESGDKIETYSICIKYIYAAFRAYILDKQWEKIINTSQACEGKVKGFL